ncbi:ribosomal protein S5-alanine N-acetyltransferase [Vibrio sp. PP-XX7]
MVNPIYDIDDEIVIRSARLDDAQMIAEYFRQNRAYLRPWEPHREEGFYQQAGWSQKLIKLKELHQLGLGYYLLILNLSGSEMLGTISFSQINRFPMYSCSVGYSLAQHVQGKGIMTRALKMACQYMFKVQNIHRICASYMPFNARSEAVLHRLGFKYEGMAKDYLLINGQWEDHNLTSLINPQWLDR